MIMLPFNFSPMRVHIASPRLSDVKVKVKLGGKRADQEKQLNWFESKEYKDYHNNSLGVKNTIYISTVSQKRIHQNQDLKIF